MTQVFLAQFFFLGLFARFSFPRHPLFIMAGYKNAIPVIEQTSILSNSVVLKL